MHKRGVQPSSCTRSTTTSKHEYIAELDELVSVLAYLITRPPIPVAVFAFFARFLERHNPKAVISGLLGTP